MTGKIDNPAKYRYEGRVIVIAVLWALIAVLAVWWAHHHLTGSVQAYLLATLLALPIVANIIAFGLYLQEEKDEFERTIVTQSMIWGIGGTLTVTTFWGSLELYGQAPHLGPFGVFIIFGIFTRISEFFVRRSYR